MGRFVLVEYGGICCGELEIKITTKSRGMVACGGLNKWYL